MYLKLSQLLSDYHLSIALYFFVSITNDAKKMPKVTTTIVAWGGAKHKEPLLWPGGDRGAPKKEGHPPHQLQFIIIPITTAISCYHSYWCYSPLQFHNFTHDIADSRNPSTYAEVESQS